MTGEVTMMLLCDDSNVLLESSPGQVAVNFCSWSELNQYVLEGDGGLEPVPQAVGERQGTPGQVTSLSQG